MMTLYGAPTSPYVRKVRVMLIELGLQDRIRTEWLDPHSRPDALTRHNPLSKIPTLETEDGDVLYDSRVICGYLDTLHDGAPMTPADGAAHWRHLTAQALSDGILDAAVERVLEGRRPADKQHDAWIAKHTAKTNGGLDELERQVASLSAPDGPTDLTAIGAGCALGYLDFRLPQDQWRTSRPALAAWGDAYLARPSMQATVPQE
ncbi:MAG: glutathione S-transferase N-terminal domain-containing protein [Alphaproteobacteria bacterium]|nr:glutathione S-transferase N-terminal domain-containing protein [Alphaproteobacteria bacterium]